MALKLEFCNVMVLVAKIREHLGDAEVERCFGAITTVTWNDGYLFREGCMNPYDFGDMLADWERRGFILLKVQDGRKRWQDLCVVHSGYGPSYPCKWIAYDRQTNTVWLKGHPPGDAVGPAGRDILA